MYAYDEDTIVAISTPFGEGGIGIVRLSGPQAVAMTHRIFVGTRQDDIRLAPTYSLHHGHIVHPESGAVLDETLVSVMRAPRSYTREDVVEINCHGGLLPLQNVLDALLACGARLATPGEFTKRAFLHGRIDLSQAESVLDIIRAKTEAGLQLAVQQLQGKLSQQVSAIRQHLTQLLAAVEVAIDFVEDDIEVISYPRIQADLTQALEQITHLLAHADEGKIVRDGLSLAIVGKPNVGKSSLLNLLLEEERAIVTPVPGTTRDTVEDYINLNSIPVRLIDTAGIRETYDQVEQIGVSRTRHVIQQADLVLCMFDTSVPWSQDDEDLLHLVTPKKKCIVANKIDLPSLLPVSDLIAKFPPPCTVFEMSVTEHIGLEAFKQAILDRVVATPLESVLVANTRHKHALLRTKDSLGRAQDSTTQEMSYEFIAVDVRDALNHLGEITGETTSEDILDEIFANFCIGK
ncbi:tRNA uridine-5-carboxymethylaminomethyl(34) synthesis GTPase MnmE [candidate division KSB3 bacterium]|uniref:tRNA modification GTPase MnmE n=1 Tax=candidate division KSB3 bacterium TaxID=2044937 RepID=A0A9D5JSZ1_9BACT|nr:tRNA uridine-5-carboxymethylaminomethyl(34) synthesis GTPase MnmE [candidate division KSB3 bacterium]MBD3323051.1 tRNA uridine-5-carboxymethylaminomethyl(34) synthesis GTPase MnmE [candidate division KSB3 bacterium]